MAYTSGFDLVLLKGLKNEQWRVWNHLPGVQLCENLKHFRLLRAKKASGEVLLSFFGSRKFHNASCYPKK